MYNRKLSGAKSVLVPIRQLGKNNLPFIEDLKNRYIKFIDFYPVDYLPDVADPGCATSDGLFLTLQTQFGNELIVNRMPMARFDYTQTTGLRQAVSSKVSMQASYIECTDATLVGKTALLIFWYDLPEYSRANKAESTITDSLTIPITTAVRHNIFPDEERMANKRFRRILLETPSVTPDFATGLTYQQLHNVYITLRKGTYNVVENLPIIYLYQIEAYEKSEFANIVFDFLNSYLTIGGANSIPNVGTDYVGKAVFINLVYEK